MQDLVFFVGDDWPNIPFVVTLADGVTADPITGWTLEFRLYEDDTQESLLFTLTIGSGLTVVDAAQGTFYATVTAARSTLLDGGPNGEPRKYYWQVQRVVSTLRRTIGFGVIPVRE